MTRPDPTKRCYRQFCGLARALDVVGERWTLLIVRDLLLGPWRYSDLLARLPGLTTNLLARRLQSLEASGLIEKRRLAPPASSDVYALTELGLSLEPAVLALGRFGQHFMAEGPRTDDRIDPGWALLSMKRRYVGPEKVRVVFRIEIRDDGREETRFFRILADPEYVDVRAISPELAGELEEVTIGTDLAALRMLIFELESATALEARGRLEVRGERGDWQRFLRAFAFGPSPEHS